MDRKMVLVVLVIVMASFVGLLMAQSETIEAHTPPNYFSSIGVSQPINWIDQPSAVHFQGNTYVAWQGTSNYLPYVSRFNETTHAWTTVKVANSNPIAGDDHGAPAMLITPNGKILVAYGAHISALKYVRGDVSDFVNGWVTMSDITATATYPHFVYVKGSLNGGQDRVWLFYRANDCTLWGFRQSSDNGTTWTVEGYPIQFASYVGGITVGPDQLGIYVQFVTLVSCADTLSRQDSYVAYYLPDAGAHWWCKASPSDFDAGTALVTAPSQCRIETAIHSNFGDVKKLGTGLTGNDVYVAYETGDQSVFGTWQYRFARWTGTVWSIQTVAYADYYQDYSDINARSTTDIDIYYETNATGQNGIIEGGVLTTRHWNGTAFGSATVILSPSDSSGNILNYPFVPVNSIDAAGLVFGERISNTSANEKIYLWGTSGFQGDPSAVPPSFCNSSIPGVNLLALLFLLIGIALLLAIFYALTPAGENSSGIENGTAVGVFIGSVVSIMIIVMIASGILGILTATGC